MLYNPCRETFVSMFKVLASFEDDENNNVQRDMSMLRTMKMWLCNLMYIGNQDN